jgi:hypothetical protein
MFLSRRLKKNEKPCFSKGGSHTFATLFQDVSAAIFGTKNKTVACRNGFK